jgi:hypothetical protein
MFAPAQPEYGSRSPGRSLSRVEQVSLQGEFWLSSLDIAS